MLVTAHVQDTQCGFKLFTRSAAKTLFGNLHLYRWAFDTELIYLAEFLHIPIQEVKFSSTSFVFLLIVVIVRCGLEDVFTCVTRTLRTSLGSLAPS
jgi:hypothetical protein